MSSNHQKAQLLLKTHRQISKRQCFGKYYSCDKVLSILSFIGHTLVELFEKNWQLTTNIQKNEFDFL